MTATDVPPVAVDGAAAMPSLELLRGLSDEHVLRALIKQDRMTRAELAAYTGISKPTVGESVRRLVTAGVLADTGERTTGRGRVGSYYALADGIGCALAVSVAPEGVVAEVADARGRVLARGEAAVTRPARLRQVARALRLVAAEVAGQAPSPVRLAMVSAADPVDRASGRTVHLPGAPFLLGELSPADVLAEAVQGPVTVDNDVNWAARAERDAAERDAPGQPWSDVFYLYLGEGLGGAVISDGHVRRGASGIAGEVAHMITAGPDGTAMRFLDVFGALGLRYPGSTAIDTGALETAIGDGTTAGPVLEALARAIGGVLSSVAALCDPRLVVLGGPWGGRPAVVDAVRTAAVGLRQPVDVRAAVVTEYAPLAGARTAAVRALGDSIVNYRSTLAPGDDSAERPADALDGFDEQAIRDRCHQDRARVWYHPVRRPQCTESNVVATAPTRCRPARLPHRRQLQLFQISLGRGLDFKRSGVSVSSIEVDRPAGLAIGRPLACPPYSLHDSAHLRNSQNYGALPVRSPADEVIRNRLPVHELIRAFPDPVHAAPG